MTFERAESAKRNGNRIVIGFAVSTTGAAAMTGSSTAGATAPGTPSTCTVSVVVSVPSGPGTA